MTSENPHEFSLFLVVSTDTEAPPMRESWTLQGKEQVSKNAQDDHEVAEMKTAAQTTFTEHLGRILGRAWRGCAHLDRRAQSWLRAQGWAPGAAKAMLLAVKFVALGLLLYAAFWLGLLVTFAVVAVWAARGSANDEHEEWEIGDQADHKRSVFYDPINYNDDPDPRFDEER